MDLREVVVEPVATADEVLAIEGKTLCNAIHEDQDGPCQTHILSAGEQSKRTNEIGAVIPMLEALESDLANKTFTADALLTQTKLANFLIGRGAHFLFAVKGNRPTC